MARRRQGAGQANSPRRCWMLLARLIRCASSPGSPTARQPPTAGVRAASTRRPGSCGRRFQPAVADAGRCGARTKDPDRDGFADHDGTRVFYEVYGAGEPTLVLVPSNPIVDSQQWKAQVPYLSRHHRVVTSTAVATATPTGQRPRRPTPRRRTSPSWRRCWTPPARTRWCWSGCATTASDGHCRFAHDHPERVAGIVAISVGVPLIAPPMPSSWRTASTRRSAPTRAGPSATATPGGATTAGSSSSSSPRCSPRPTRPSRSRTAWPRAWRPAWRPWWPRWMPRPSCRETRSRRSVGGSGRRC